MRTRREITIERERWVVVRRRRGTAWCNVCSREVEMLSVDDAAIFAGVNSRTMFHWVESGAVHSSETPEGLLIICPHSLRPIRL